MGLALGLETPCFGRNRQPDASVKTLSDVGEKRLITELVLPTFAQSLNFTQVEVPAGDDACVLSVPPGSSIVATIDKVPERLIAQDLGLMTFSDVGRYSVAVSLSDLAAMGAAPLALLTSVACPPATPYEHFAQLIEGIQRASVDWGVPVTGGDTKSATVESIATVALGVVPTGTALTRGGARPGDIVIVTGTPGRFATSLHFFLNGGVPALDASTDHLILPFKAPEPRIGAGIALRETHACTACQDISDGLGQTLREIAAASAVGIEVYADAVESVAPPNALEVAERSGVRVYELVMGSGADLELVCSVAPGAESYVIDCLKRAGVTASVIGRVTNSNGVTVHDGGTATELRTPGFEHFTGKSDLVALRTLR